MIMDFESRRRMRITREISNKNVRNISNVPNYESTDIQTNKKENMSLFQPLKNSRDRNILNEWSRIDNDGPMIISFISDPIGSNFYSSRITELVRKVHFFGLNYLIRQYESDREYFQNCCYKPVFIQEIMKKYSKDVVWVDGDTNLKESLASFCNLSDEFDLGLVSYTNDINGFVASPIFIRNTSEAFRVITAWADHCTEKVETGQPELDHDAIKHSIIPQFRSTVKIKLSGSDFHNGRFLENINSEAPNKRSIMNIMKELNPHRPFNYTNKDFIIV